MEGEGKNPQRLFIVEIRTNIKIEVLNKGN